MLCTIWNDKCLDIICTFVRTYFTLQSSEFYVRTYALNGGVGDKYVLKGTYLSTLRNSQNPSGKGIFVPKALRNAFWRRKCFPSSTDPTAVRSVLRESTFYVKQLSVQEMLFPEGFREFRGVERYVPFSTYLSPTPPP